MKEFAEKCQFLETPLCERPRLACDSADSTELATPDRAKRLVRNVQTKHQWEKTCPAPGA
jgi:hypothetical protein